MHDPIQLQQATADPTWLVLDANQHPEALAMRALDRMGKSVSPMAKIP